MKRATCTLRENIMPTFVALPISTGYYYSTAINNNIQVHPKIGFDRKNPNNVAYTLYGLSMTTHVKDDGFNLMTDINTYFKKGDMLSVYASNLSNITGSYKTSFQGALAYDGPARFIFTSAEMLKLGPGKIRILLDVYSQTTDTYYVPNAYDIEFVNP